MRRLVCAFVFFFANHQGQVFSRGCAGWSAPLFFANQRRQVFSRGCEGWSAAWFSRVEAQIYQKRCVNVQAGLCLCFSQTLKTDFFASRPINLTKALNRLCECTGWYAPLTKTLIRMCVCAGCSAPLFFVNHCRHVFEAQI